MAYFRVFYFCIGLTWLHCNSVISETEVVPTDEQDALLSGKGEMNDEDLWNLLKTISRNGSEYPIEGFRDYEDYTLVDDIYPTDASVIAEFSPTDTEEYESFTEIGATSEIYDDIGTNEITTNVEVNGNYFTPTELGETSTYEGEPTAREALTGSIEIETITAESIVYTTKEEDKMHSITSSPLYSIQSEPQISNNYTSSTIKNKPLKEQLNSTTSLNPTKPFNFPTTTTPEAISPITALGNEVNATHTTASITDLKDLLITTVPNNFSDSLVNSTIYDNLITSTTIKTIKTENIETSDSLVIDITSPLTTPVPSSMTNIISTTTEINSLSSEINNSFTKAVSSSNSSKNETITINTPLTAKYNDESEGSTVTSVTAVNTENVLDMFTSTITSNKMIDNLTSTDLTPLTTVSIEESDEVTKQTTALYSDAYEDVTKGLNIGKTQISTAANGITSTVTTPLIVRTAAETENYLVGNTTNSSDEFTSTITTPMNSLSSKVLEGLTGSTTTIIMLPAKETDNASSSVTQTITFVSSNTYEDTTIRATTPITPYTSTTANYTQGTITTPIILKFSDKTKESSVTVVKTKNASDVSINTITTPISTSSSELINDLTGTTTTINMLPAKETDKASSSVTQKITFVSSNTYEDTTIRATTPITPYTSATANYTQGTITTPIISKFSDKTKESSVTVVHTKNASDVSINTITTPISISSSEVINDLTGTTTVSINLSTKESNETSSFVTLSPFLSTDEYKDTTRTMASLITNHKNRAEISTKLMKISSSTNPVSEKTDNMKSTFTLPLSSTNLNTSTPQTYHELPVTRESFNSTEIKDKSSSDFFTNVTSESTPFTRANKMVNNQSVTTLPILSTTNLQFSVTNSISSTNSTNPNIPTYPIKYNETSTIRTTVSNIASKAEKQFSTTQPFIGSSVKETTISKLKASLDPSKKVIIPVEDNYVPKLNLKGKSVSATISTSPLSYPKKSSTFSDLLVKSEETNDTIELLPKKKVIGKSYLPQQSVKQNCNNSLLTNNNEYVKKLPTNSISNLHFQPGLQTSPLPKQHESVLEQRRKVFISPEDKIGFIVPKQPHHENKLQTQGTQNGKSERTLTTKPCNKCSNTLGNRNVFDSSRMFMIDEVTSPPQIDKPLFITKCNRDHSNDEKEVLNKPRENKTPYRKNYSQHKNLFEYPVTLKTKVDLPSKSIISGKDDQNNRNNSLGAINLEAKQHFKRKHSFDPKKIYIIGNNSADPTLSISVTTPANLKKSKLDQNRKFVIDDTNTNTDVKQKEKATLSKDLFINNKIINRPVIQIIPNFNFPHKKDNMYSKPRYFPSKDINEQVKYKIESTHLGPQNSIPEFLCFEIKNEEKKPMLSCAPLNSTIRSNVMHFLKNIYTHNQPYGYHQKFPITITKVLLKNQNPLATSIVVKNLPTPHEMKYDISGSILHSEKKHDRDTINSKISFNTPDSKILITDTQMQDIVRHSIIPLKHIVNRQNLIFLEEPSNLESYQQVYSSASRRLKRSSSNKCNTDGVYEDEGSSLAFVFDNTGSMRPELEQMRQTAIHITTELTEKKKNVIRDYILVTFNDPEVAAPFCTNNYNEFIGALKRITVFGGHDCPELALTGLKATLQVTRPKSFIFVITDADAKDYYEEENIQPLIMRKSPFIFFLMTERCYGWKHQKGFDVFYSISEQTNGQIIMMDKADVKKNSLLRKVLDSLTEDYLQKGLVPLKKISSKLPALIPYSVPVPVDPGIKKVTFIVTGSQPKLEITDPKGGKPFGKPKEFPKFKSITYAEPLPGVWNAAIGSSSGHSFSSYGISKTQIRVGFSVLKTNKFSETSHRPLKSAENYILVEVSNPELVGNISHIDLVNLKGHLLSTIHLTRNPDEINLYSGGPFLPPDENFNMEMNGYGADGSPLKRISATSILPQLPELPYVTLPSENKIEEGATYLIKCRVESLVPVTVKIYKRDDPNLQQIYKMKQTGDVHFEVKKISLKDQGVYVCWANNVAGTKIKEIKLTVRVNPPVVSVKDEVLFIPKTSVLIPCIVHSLQPFTVTWKKGTSSRWNDVKNSHNIYSTEKGLTIPYPTKSDEGWYQCTASNIGGDFAATTYLKLSTPPYIEISGLRKFYENFNITITCSVISGIPSPDLKWKKNGIDIIEGNKRIFITYLEKYTRIEILNAIKEDEGIYTCSAHNFAGQDNKDLNLMYEEKPKAIASVKLCNVIHGGNCTLKCIISGVPTPDVIWKKDGRTITTMSSPNIQVLLNKSLLINNAELLDSGIYNCVAQSNIGYSEDSIFVTVSGSSPRIVEAPTDISIEIGENGRLQCVADGTPSPKIIWEKNHKVVMMNTDNWNENFLEINNASLTDAGLYTCTAENILGQEQSQAMVNITGGVLPVLSKEKDLEVKKVLPGEKVELNCIVIGGKPIPFKEWYKNGNLLSQQPSNGIKLENGSYFISSVSPLDIGLYECIARNDLGSDVKKIQLKFYEQPRIDLSISSNVVATTGKPAKLLCKVSGDPPPKVTWKRHSSSKTIRGTHANDTNELIFDVVTEEDSGRYICLAENIAGVARRVVSLSVMVPPKIYPWPIEKFVEVGNILTLECRSRAIPRPSIQWLKNNVTIPKSKYYGQFLRFTAEPSDSGTYSCIAENDAGKDIAETNIIVLVAPQIKDGSTTIKAITGREALIPCDVSGNPQPSVTWHLNGELIKKQTGSEPATLRLLNVTEADAGTYICIAQNKAGTNKKKMELIVLTPPKILPWTEPLKVVVGDYVNVTCQTFAYPEASISWLKDRQPVPLDFIRNGKNLEFIFEKKHEGLYSCVAKNEAGIDSKDLLLVGLGPPAFAKHLPFSVDVLRGSDIDIPCIAFGDPKPILGWNRNDIVLKSDIRRIINSETGQLTILNAAPEDDGYYNCTAANRAGLVWRTVEVNVLELPTATLTVSNSVVKEGEEVIFTCFVAGNPRPKIYWKKNGKILPTENDHKLRITAYYEDRGNYTCVVKNLAGEGYSSVTVDVSVFPTIPGSRDERIVKLKGESVAMNCSAKGIPEPEVVWFFNNTQLGENLVTNQGILVLKNIGTENAGIYFCVAKNFAGSVEKKFTLYVHVKPMITDEVDTKILINEGKDFSLPCNADGIPKPKITWRKYDKVNVNKNNRDLSVTVHNNILLLFNADNNTGGIYICSATNIEGEDTRHYFINVQGNNKKVEEGMKVVEIKEGENGILNCDSKPGSKIIWLKDNKTLDKMPLERADDIHYIIEDTGKFLKISEAYVEDTGIYSCIVVHPDGNSSNFFSVNVNSLPYFNDLYPTLEYTVRENKSITLHCLASGSPTPQINWRLAEKNLPINDHTLPGVQIFGDNDNTLLIKSAKLTDSGLYLCSAVNKLGKENRIFNVKVIGPPQRHGLEVSNIEVVSGSKLELNCSIDGSPHPNFKWFYTPEKGKEERTLRFVTKNLYIGYVQTEDEGLYTCLASNIVGNSTKTFNVSVIDTPRIKRDLNNKIVLAEGDDLELVCKCEGKKPTSIKWFFNGSYLNASDSIFQRFNDYNTTDYKFKRVNVSKETEGFYTCVISNIAGSDEKKYKVMVIAAPKILNDEWRKLQKLEYQSGSTIEIKCPVESFDDFKIQWKKNGLLIPGFENKTFYIASGSVDDQAEYVCIASNIAGQLASKFQVTVLG